MSPTSYQLLYSAITIFLLYHKINKMQMAEEEGFEPPRALTPVGFQDRSLQPDLGIPPKLLIGIMVDPVGLEPTTNRL